MSETVGRLIWISGRLALVRLDGTPCLWLRRTETRRDVRLMMERAGFRLTDDDRVVREITPS